MHRADDVRLKELFGAVDRSVDMAFGGEVHHGVRLVIDERCFHRSCVTDIDLEMAVALVVCNLGNAALGCGVGHLVDIDDLVVGVVDQVTNNRRPDEAAAAGDENAHQGNPWRNSANDGAAASLSDRTASSLSTGQSIPRSGSSNRMLRSA